MAKEIDKIIQSKTAPKSNNVLWDDGENLKINRNGKWESTSKENSSNQELYAYPVNTLDGKENKVIGLGGESQYIYIGELIASEFGTLTEEKVLGDVMHTRYAYQPIYDDKYVEYFEEFMNDKYITLYIGNDVDGYSSNKVYISEDADNLTYYIFNFVGGFGPIMLEVAISPDYMLHYRNYYHYANKNSKVFFADIKQQLDINLIPQEIARKEDISPEIIKSIKNYNAELCQAEFCSYYDSGFRRGLFVHNGELGLKTLEIYNYIEGISVSFQYEKEDQTYFYYSSDVADIKIYKNNTQVVYDRIVYSYNLSAKKLLATVNYNEFNQTFSFPKNRSQSNVADSLVPRIRFYFKMNHQPGFSIIDSAYYYWDSSKAQGFCCIFLRHKYIELEVNMTTEESEDTKYHCLSLEVTKEIDIPSLESRLAALEAK